MLYTTYISRIKDIPDNARKIIIMRYMPKSLKDPKYDLEWKPELAPNDFLLNRFKTKQIKPVEFRDEFIDYLETNRLAIQAINDVISSLDAGEDVYLICCEKNYFECHRRWLSHHLLELGYKGDEM